MTINKTKFFNYLFALLITITIVFMLFIYFNIYSGLPKEFYKGFLISFFIILFISIYNFEIAVLIFVFFIPLLGFLGPLFQTQDAYIILIMCIALILGYLIRCIKDNTPILSFRRSFNVPTIIMLIIITISFILVIWRIYLADFKMIGFLKKYIDTDYFKTVKSTSIIYSIFFTGLLFQIIMTESIFSKKFINKIFYVLFFSFLVVFIIGIYQKFFNHNFGVVTHWVYGSVFQINSTLRFANSLGEYIIFIIPIFIGFLGYFYKTSKLNVILCIMTIITATILLYYNGNRTGILGVLITFLFYLIFFIWLFFKKIIFKKIPKNYLKNIFSILVLTLIIIILFLSVFIYMKNLNAEETDSITLKRLKFNFDLITNFRDYKADDFFRNILTGRNNLWLLAIDMFRDFPLTGVGIGQYEHMLYQYNIARFGKIVMHDAFACNYYIHVLAELGIFYLISLLSFLALIIITFFKKIKLIAQKEKFLYLGIFMAMISSLIAYNFNAGTAFIEIQYMFSLIIGLIANKTIFKVNEIG